jgi:hypothetical protein
MNITQYVHLMTGDAVTATRLPDGMVRLAVSSEGRPVIYLFLTEEQTHGLRTDLAEPRHARHTEHLLA